MRKLNPNYQYVFVAGLAVFFTFLFHEFSHWATGEILGNKMGMNLNAAFPLKGYYLEEWHSLVVTAVGPLLTLAQGFFVYFVMQGNKNRFLYPFLFTPLVMRILALFMNFITPNDEGRISLSLGLGLLTVPIIICSILFYLTYKASQQNQYSAKFNVSNILLIIFFSSVLILASQ